MEAINMKEPEQQPAKAQRVVIGWQVRGLRHMRGWKSQVVKTRSDANKIARSYWAGLTYVVPIFEGDS